MKKLKFLFLLMFLFFTALEADDLLIVNKSDGSKITYTIEDIKKITFDTTLVNIDGEKLKNVLKAFTLFQNYPNPFNPTTTIRYNLPKPGNVEIRIFNMNGQLVRNFSIINGASGVHQVSWNGKNELGRVVASGLYVYQVKFENKVISKKMILIR
jgi:hypothetical protein